MSKESIFYKEKVGSIFFNMIKVTSKNKEMWDAFFFSIYHSHGVDDGIVAAKEVYDNYNKFKNKPDLWVGCVSNEQITGPSDIECKGIEMFMTVTTSEHAPFTSHMGIQRRNCPYKHPHISHKLHAFCARVTSIEYPDKEYMVFNPNDGMHNILSKKISGKILAYRDFIQNDNRTSAKFHFPDTNSPFFLDINMHNCELKWFFGNQDLWGCRDIEAIKKASPTPERITLKGIEAIKIKDLLGMDPSIARAHIDCYYLQGTKLEKKDIVDSDVLTPKNLSSAIKDVDFQKVKEIVGDNPASVTFSNSSGQNALHYAASNKDEQDILEYLLQFYHQPLDSLLDSRGFTPLDYALRAKNKMGAAILIREGASFSKLCSSNDPKKAAPYLKAISEAKLILEQNKHSPIPIEVATEKIFYTQKVGDIYLNMIKVTEANFDTLYKHFTKVFKPQNDPTGIQAAISAFDTYKLLSKKSYFWVGCVSNMEITNPNNIAGKKIEMVVTFNTSEHSPFISLMGIQRLQCSHKHSHISLKLQAFCAMVSIIEYPDKKYMVFKPMLHMRALLSDELIKTRGKMLHLGEFVSQYDENSITLNFPDSTSIKLSSSDYDGDLEWFFNNDILWGAEEQSPCKNIIEDYKFHPGALEAVSIKDLTNLVTSASAISCWDEEWYLTVKKLSDAIKGNDIEKVKHIVEEYPDIIKFSNSTGQTALHYAAKLECDDEILSFILSKIKGNLNEMLDSKGYSPLDYALMGGKVSHGALLLKQNATHSKLTQPDSAKFEQFQGLIADMQTLSEQIASETSLVGLAE